MRAKKEIQKEIQGVNKKIEKLEDKREELLKELTDCKDLTRAEKLQDVLSYGTDEPYCINSNSSIIENFLDNRRRYETIRIERIIEYAAENYLCDNYEDQLKATQMLGWDYEISKEDYESWRESSPDYVMKIEDFEEFVDDLIKANCKTFKYDW